MDKKYIFGIAAITGLLAVAAGIVALQKTGKGDRAKRQLKKAAKKVKKESRKIADLASDKAKNITE